MAKYDLLSIERDTKTVKGNKEDVLSGILYLAPAQEADGVHDLCPMSTPECEKVCLYGAGMAGVFPSIKRARIAKTLRYLADRAKFERDLSNDIGKLERAAASRGMRPAVRQRSCCGR